MAPSVTRPWRLTMKCRLRDCDDGTPWRRIQRASRYVEGRVWMQLECWALRRAVESSGSDRAEAIANALAFKSGRPRRFPARQTTNGATRFGKGLPPPALLPRPMRTVP